MCFCEIQFKIFITEYDLDSIHGLFTGAHKIIKFFHLTIIAESVIHVMLLVLKLTFRHIV